MKLIKQEWDEYSRRVIRPEADAVVVKWSKRHFYAGALALWSAVTNHTDLPPGVLQGVIETELFEYFESEGAFPPQGKVS